MKAYFDFLKNHLLYGVFAYSLFGIYALTISPLIADFFEYEEQNYLLAFLGFGLLTAEFFAFKFKLKMIRARARERRLIVKKETGIDEIPKISRYLLFEFFFRLAFRFGIIMFSINALGIPCTEKEFSQYGGILALIGFVADIWGLMHLYLGSGLETEDPQDERAALSEITEQENWSKINLLYGAKNKYLKYEMYADLVLQIYSIAVYTVFWKTINETGIDIIHNSYFEHDSISTAAVSLFSFLFIFVMLGLTPIRIAYWIEDSLMAVTKRELFFTRLTFTTVAIFTCAPSIIKFVTIYIFNLKDSEDVRQPEYIGYLISLMLFIILTILQIIFYRMRMTKK